MPHTTSVICDWNHIEIQWFRPILTFSSVATLELAVNLNACKTYKVLIHLWSSPLHSERSVWLQIAPVPVPRHATELSCTGPFFMSPPGEALTEDLIPHGLSNHWWCSNSVGYCSLRFSCISYYYDRNLWPSAQKPDASISWTEGNTSLATWSCKQLLSYTDTTRRHLRHWISVRHCHFSLSIRQFHPARPLEKSSSTRPRYLIPEPGRSWTWPSQKSPNNQTPQRED